MPRMGGLELLEKLASDSQTMAVIVVTAQGTIDSAVQAMRMGAYDYITKPIDTNRLRTILQNASALLGTRVELEVTRRKLRDAGSLGSSGRFFEEDAGALPADRDGRSQYGVGADYRGKRNRKGTGRAHHSRTQSAAHQAVHSHQLRGHP